MISILYVCVANTCRSPALMATLNHLAAKRGIKIHADSCGIGWVHLGQKPNLHTFEAAKKRGILIDHKSQQFQGSFFEEYDYILTVDEAILEQLKVRGPKYKDKIHLATAFSSKFKNQPIPDPYYLSESDFDDVIDMVVDSSEGFLDTLIDKYSLEK